MLLGEPPRSPYDLNFSIVGIPIRVHPWFWLVTLMLGSQAGNVASVLTWIIAVFLSILVHEIGHALTMRAYGFRPWITLYGLGGQTAYDQGYATHSRGLGSLGQILISFAGPAAGFLLAAILAFGIVLAGHRENLFFVSPFRLRPFIFGLPNEQIAMLLNDIFFISVIWGLVNLLPIYPLDGGHIAREILLKINTRNGIRWSLMLSMVAAGLMAITGFVLWRDLLVAIFFGYLAYTSYATLQAYSGRNPW